MSSWFGKYNSQNKVSDFTVKGNASDVTKKRRVKEIYCTVRNDVTDGVYVNTKKLSVNADDTLNHVESQELRRDLIDGQNCYYQDVSQNSAYVSEYTQVYNPNPCCPQVVDLSNIVDFTNVDISNMYQGVRLWDVENNTVQNTVISHTYQYGEISANVVDTSSTTYDFSGTPSELILINKKYNNGNVTFGNLGC